MQHKIEVAVILNVDRANPNGDPFNGNGLRTDYDGFGEISDVCIKRKIRARLMDKEHSVFVQSDDRKIDPIPSLKYSSARVHRTFNVNPDGSYQLHNLDVIIHEETDRF